MLGDAAHYYKPAYRYRLKALQPASPSQPHLAEALPLLPQFAIRFALRFALHAAILATMYIDIDKNLTV